MSVNEEGAVVNPAAEEHQLLFDIAAQADAREGIRQGLDDVRKGRTRGVQKFFKEFEAEHPSLRNT